VSRADELMYHAGLTAQGCWDEMDQYDREAIEKFARLIVIDIDQIVEKYSRANAESDSWVHMIEMLRQEIRQQFDIAV